MKERSFLPYFEVSFSYFFSNPGTQPILISSTTEPHKFQGYQPLSILEASLVHKLKMAHNLTLASQLQHEATSLQTNHEKHPP